MNIRFESTATYYSLVLIIEEYTSLDTISAFHWSDASTQFPYWYTEAALPDAFKFNKAVGLNLQPILLLCYKCINAFMVQDTLI